MTRAAGVLVAAALCTAGSAAFAQTAPTSTPPAASTRMTNEERVVFGILSATVGLRIGTAIMLGAFDRTPQDPHPETYWILPGTLALVFPTAALLIEHRFPMHRGRAFALGAGAGAGYVAALSLAAWAQHQSFPSGPTFSGWATFAGTTSGLALGALVGHLTDASQADSMLVATAAVGGALLGAFGCGAVRCGPQIGAWSLLGELGMVSLALGVRTRLRAGPRTLRMVAVGGIGGVALLGGGTLVAHLVRDGSIDASAAQRAAAFGIAGLLLGAGTFFALGRAADGAVIIPTAQPVPGGLVVGATVSTR